MADDWKKKADSWLLAQQIAREREQKFELQRHISRVEDYRRRYRCPIRGCDNPASPNAIWGKPILEGPPTEDRWVTPIVGYEWDKPPEGFKKCDNCQRLVCKDHMHMCGRCRRWVCEDYYHKGYCKGCWQQKLSK